MLEFVFALLAIVRIFFGSPHDTAIEILALRRQVSVLKRKRPRPKLNSLGRLFWTIPRHVWPRWADVLIIVKSETVAGWHRAGSRIYRRWRSRPRGDRTKITGKILVLIRRLAEANPDWGAPKIRGELQKLGFVLSERRVVQQLGGTFPEAGPYRYVILGRDAKFDNDVLTFLKATGLTPKRTSVQAPWPNGISERWVGSCRREMLDHIMALNEHHLRRLIRDYVRYYHPDRIHNSLEKDTPNRRPVEHKSSPNSVVISNALWDTGMKPDGNSPIEQWAILALMKLLLALLLAVGVCAAQTAPPQAAPSPARGAARGPAVRLRSKITIYDLRTKTSKVIYTADTRWEAPNWSHDGKYLLANSAGTLWKIPVDAPAPVTPEKLGLDPMYSCNNDHGISFDGKMLAFSAGSPTARSSQVYLATMDGKNPKQLTSVGVNYFHGFSPDGKWISFIGQRPVNGVTKTEIYRVSADGAKEEKLTFTGGYDDGTDHSPDGKWIYFNSNRLGTTNDGWDIWRMPPDGAGPKDAKAERVTHDKWEDWFPHVSPDGKRIVFLSFPPGTENHNGQMNVEMRMISAPGKKTNAESGEIQTLVKFFGGQGTINVNSWSPDSKRFAFVVYEALPPASAPPPGRS